MEMSSQSSNNNTNNNNNRTLLPKLHLITQQGPIRLILASQSPRRREILDMMGFQNQYHVQPSPLNEEELQIRLLKEGITKDPKRYTEILAMEKAKALVDSCGTTTGCYGLGGLVVKDDSNADKDDTTEPPPSTTITTLVLGSDTIVDLNGTILEKPSDGPKAVSMLQQLSGQVHEVHTAVVVYKTTTTTVNHNNHNSDQQHTDPSPAPITHSEKVVSFVDTTKVKFMDLSLNDIQAYVDTGEPMDKAGSYGIQGIGGQLVERIDGDFFTVMGLPMHRLGKELTRILDDEGVKE